MTEADHHARRGKRADALVAHRFRRDGGKQHRHKGAGSDQRRLVGVAHRPDQLRVVRALAGDRQMRPFEMQPEKSRNLLARSLGADVVVAVDISARPSGRKNQGPVDLLLDTIAIMGGALGKSELAAADVVIRPELRGLPAASFQQRHEAILEGEKAGFAALARVREAMAAWERKNG